MTTRRAAARNLLPVLVEVLQRAIHLDRGSTHWEGCENEPSHPMCKALAAIRAEMEKAK